MNRERRCPDRVLSNKLLCSSSCFSGERTSGKGQAGRCCKGESSRAPAALFVGKAAGRGGLTTGEHESFQGRLFLPLFTEIACPCR